MAVEPELLTGDMNERTTGYLSISFKDKNGDLEAPTSFSYKIVDVETAVVIKDDTSLTPLATIEIELTPTESVIVDRTKKYRLIRVGILATYNGNDKLSGAFIIRVLVIEGLPT